MEASRDFLRLFFIVASFQKEIGMNSKLNKYHREQCPGNIVQYKYNGMTCYSCPCSSNYWEKISTVPLQYFDTIQNIVKRKNEERFMHFGRSALMKVRSFASHVYPHSGPVYPHSGPVYPYDGPVYPHSGPVYPYDGPVYPYDGPVYPYDGPVYPLNPASSQTLIEKKKIDKDEENEDHDKEKKSCRKKEKKLKYRKKKKTKKEQEKKEQEKKDKKLIFNIFLTCNVILGTIISLVTYFPDRCIVQNVIHKVQYFLGLQGELKIFLDIEKIREKTANDLDSLFREIEEEHKSFVYFCNAAIGSSILPVEKLSKYNYDLAQIIQFSRLLKLHHKEAFEIRCISKEFCMKQILEQPEDDEWVNKYFVEYNIDRGNFKKMLNLIKYSEVRWPTQNELIPLNHYFHIFPIIWGRCGDKCLFCEKDAGVTFVTSCCHVQQNLCSCIVDDKTKKIICKNRLNDCFNTHMSISSISGENVSILQKTFQVKQELYLQKKKIRYVLDVNFKILKIIDDEKTNFSIS